MDNKGAVVLPFPTEDIREKRRRASAPKNSARRPGRQDDADTNAEWDVLLTRAVQAWCWRDPDSIRVVEQCLARLKVSVEVDWS